jgi:hypothetical protein
MSALVPAALWKARERLDEALVLLTGLKDEEAPTREVVFHLSTALLHVQEALAARRDPQALRKLGNAGLGRARIALTLLEGWEAQKGVTACGEAVRSAVGSWVEPGMADVVLDLPSEEGESQIRAPDQEPLLLVRKRGVFAPGVVLTEPEPADAEFPVIPEPAEGDDGVSAEGPTLEELLAQGEAAAAALDGDAPLPPPTAVPESPPEPTPLKALELAQFGAPQTRHDVEWLRARDLLEDLGMLSLMRLPAAAWRDSHSPEKRLLARAEALFACGPGVRNQLSELLWDRPVPDAEALWAALFFFGSFKGDDARDQVLRLLRTAGLEHEAPWKSAADALLFVLNPGVLPALEPWLERGGWQARLAARVLGRRRALPASRWIALLGVEDLEVRREVAAALAAAPGAWEPSDLKALLKSDDDSLVGSALQALLHRYPAVAFERARAFTLEGRGELGGAARWMALSGGASVAADFEAALGRNTSPALLEAVGWFGSVQFVDLLLAELQKKSLPALEALQRFTGASLTDAVPAPEYEPEQLPFTPGFQPKLPVFDLTPSPALWSAWWAQHGKRARPSIRHRWGHPWTLKDNLWEMRDAAISGPMRDWAHLEAVARTRLEQPLDTWDFVARQEAQLEQCRVYLEEQSVKPGTWPAAR